MRLQYRSVRRVDANPGDWGLDVFVGEIDGTISVWQAKFFIDGFDDSQKAQVRDSFERAISCAKEEGHKLDGWTLCVPIDLDGKNLKWWNTWKKKKERENSIKIELWDRTELEGLLLTPDAEPVRSIYFPRIGAGLAPSAPLGVEELPSDVSYENMLFIKQLEAAQIREHDSAKQQFFNAELLGREVADKRIPEHMSVLQGERADLRSMWEDRFNRACGQATVDGLLPSLHWDVMDAIERRHDRAQVQVLPMHLIHRKGVMHQVVDAGHAGWIRDFSKIVKEHGV